MLVKGATRESIIISIQVLFISHRGHHFLQLFKINPKNNSSLKSANDQFPRQMLGPVNSPHKWSVTRKMFPLDDVIMVKWLFSVLQHMHCPLTSGEYISSSRGLLFQISIMKKYRSLYQHKKGHLRCYTSLKVPEIAHSCNRIIIS